MVLETHHTIFDENGENDKHDENDFSSFSLFLAILSRRNIFVVFVVTIFLFIFPQISAAFGSTVVRPPRAGGS